ncbi:hypothetical protein DDG30_12220, partial [Neisseria gonorrhoeae]
RPLICRTSGPDSRPRGNLGRSVRKLIGKKGFLRFYVLDSRPRGNDGMYSELNLNQYGVASPFRTIRTACGPPPCPDFR